MNSYYGYVTSRPFGGLVMPVPAQNSCIREYVSRNNGIYILPPLESYYPNCYHQLFGLLHAVPYSAKIVTYSVTILPLDNKNKIAEIKRISTEKSIQFAFVLENLECSLNDDKFTKEVNNYNMRDVTLNVNKLMERLR